MIVRNLGTASMESINEFLRREQIRRSHSPTRTRDPDMVFVFEPKEAFALGSSPDDDLAAIRDPNVFWSYVARCNVPVIGTDRGGGMIWHGPGQVVLAPIVDLERARINLFNTYITYLEEICIRTLRDFGVAALRNHIARGAQGAWTRDPETDTLEKIAFLGCHDSAGIVIHGCAINVAPDLYPFSLINPCNLTGVNATSMERVTGRRFRAEDVAQRLIYHYRDLMAEKPNISLK